MKFEALRNLALAISSLLIPAAIAVVGYWHTKSVADAAVRKDFLQLALATLSDPERGKDQRWSDWAIAVVDKTAPVPFSPALRQELASGNTTIYVPFLQLSPEPPKVLMEPPTPWTQPPDGVQTNGDLIESYLENFGSCQENAIRLEYLQRWTRDSLSISIDGKPAATQSTEHSSPR